MDENIIYFTAGFKSYDITRVNKKQGIWFDWVERGRHHLWRMCINLKVMQWIISFLDMASKVKGRSIRRWRIKEQMHNYFCSLKHNQQGRYVSIIAVQGNYRPVIVIPEATFNAGWGLIVQKIQRFINVKRQKDVGATNIPSTSKAVVGGTQNPDAKNGTGVSFTGAVKNIKWHSNGKEMVVEKITENRISIAKGTNSENKQLLERCIVGRFAADVKEMPTLADVRRWCVNTWKDSYGINVYELIDFYFLFEFPNANMAEHVLAGEWNWKQNKLSLNWWSPSATCWSCQQERNWVWVRLLGLPLNLWSHETFKAVGDFCGGWIENEEETSLKNHMKWARIKVRGDGENIPRSIEIEDDGLVYKIPIWCEMPTIVMPSQSPEKLGEKFIDGMVFNGENKSAARSTEPILTSFVPDSYVENVQKNIVGSDPIQDQEGPSFNVSAGLGRSSLDLIVDLKDNSDFLGPELSIQAYKDKTDFFGSAGQSQILSQIKSYIDSLLGPIKIAIESAKSPTREISLPSNNQTRIGAQSSSMEIVASEKGDDDDMSIIEGWGEEEPIDATEGNMQISETTNKERWVLDKGKPTQHPRPFTRSQAQLIQDTHLNLAWKSLEEDSQRGLKTLLWSAMHGGNTLGHIERQGSTK